MKEGCDESVAGSGGMAGGRGDREWLRGGQGVPPGRDAAKKGDLDRAVAYYRRRRRRRPTTRTTRSRWSARCWRRRAPTSTRASEFEEQDQLEAARGEYQLASRVRPEQPRRGGHQDRGARSEDSRARSRRRGRKPADEQLREQARAAAAAPLLNPASREPLRLQLHQRRLDILNSIGNASGINITYDPRCRRRPTTRAARRRDARAGAQADHGGEPAVATRSSASGRSSSSRTRRRSTRSTTSRSSRRSTCRTPTSPS